MLLTISTTHQPATDLGYVLMKHPDNVHSIDVSFGRATLFYPFSTKELCTAAITLQVDPVALVRGKTSIEEQYVNDRPYAASSLLSVALGRLLNTAMAGRSKLRQELADTPIPLECFLTPLPARGSADLLARLFEPLGYTVAVEPVPLDPAHPDWGPSPYVSLSLKGNVRVQDLLTHLFVLIPVLDNAKHYYVGEDEVKKLLKKGDGWLEAHPDKELIVRRYLLGFKSLVRSASGKLEDRAEAEEPEEQATRDAVEEKLEKPIRLNTQRMDYIANLIRQLGAASVLDLGCGEGRLLRQLLQIKGLDRIVGVEVAPRVLAKASERLKLDHMPDIKRKRIELLQGSLVYRDDRLKGFDVAALVEVIEHVDAERLPALEAALFGHAQPANVIVTTPNSEYNVLFEGMEPEALRHPDHRFEWSRTQFNNWAEAVAKGYGYNVRYEGIGHEDKTHGYPTQVAIFSRAKPTQVTA